MPILLWASLPSHASGDSYLHDLVAEAHANSLATTREWLALVHYRANLIFPGVTGQADDDHFYLAADGKTNPAAELDATLRVFFDPPVVETFAGLRRQARGIEVQRLLQPVIARDEPALRVLRAVRLRLRRIEIHAQGRVELGGGVRLAVGGEIEMVVIGLAGDARKDQNGAVVHQGLPLARGGKTFRVRLRDEFVQITVAGGVARQRGLQQDRHQPGSRAQNRFPSLQKKTPSKTTQKNSSRRGGLDETCV